jgi:hypothetical protein
MICWFGDKNDKLNINNKKIIIITKGIQKFNKKKKFLKKRWRKIFRKIKLKKNQRKVISNLNKKIS